MKKLILGSIFSIFCIFSASAELGMNVGVSGSAGVFYASATEVDTGTHGTTTGTDETIDANDILALGWTSVFIEKSFLDRFAIGFEYVTEDLSTETASRGHEDKTTSDTASTVNNDVQVDFTNLSTLYVSMNVTDNAYIRAGVMDVDVETNETLGTGSSYGNTSLTGAVFGLGWDRELASGVFIRAETNYLDFEGKSLTSSSGSQKITLDTLEGVQAKISLGKSF